MARTFIPAVSTSENSSVAMSYVAGDAANGMQIEQKKARNMIVHVKNAGASPCVLTLVTAVPGVNLVRTVPAGAERFIGPFDSGRFAQPGLGVIWLDLDQAAGVTVGGLRVNS